MISLLRSSQFVYKDDSGSVFVELRRHHDIRKQSTSNAHRRFIVVKRFSRLPIPLIKKGFDNYNEALRHWSAEATKLEDTGMQRRDIPIIGFHEEG